MTETPPKAPTDKAPTEKLAEELAENTSDQEKKPSEQVRQFTVSDDDNGIRLDRWFKRNLPQIGFATVSRWARTGQIRVDGKRAKPEDRLAEGQLSVSYTHLTLPTTPYV